MEIGIGDVVVSILAVCLFGAIPLICQMWDK